MSACDTLRVEYQIYDIKNPDLYKEIFSGELAGLFIIPVFENYVIRNIFHETVHLLVSESKIPIYPSVRELDLYESKRTLTNFLKINNIPHPSTSIFYDCETAMKFIEKMSYPAVFKTNIGASASGVEIVRNNKQAIRLANQIFNKYYLRKMETDIRNSEWGYMLIQEYIKEVNEHRIIKIGESWFGHQKWKRDNQEFLSGSGVTKWRVPSRKILDFCNDIAVRHGFTTMSFDVFENIDGELMINELQTWFGSYNPSQMYTDDGIPGRYIKTEGEWSFEPGLFNVNGSVLLRIVDFISSIEQIKQKVLY
jgi:hypothetical protein